MQPTLGRVLSQCQLQRAAAPTAEAQGTESYLDALHDVIHFNNLQEAARQQRAEHAEERCVGRGDVGVCRAHERAELPHGRVPLLAAAQQSTQQLQAVLHACMLSHDMNREHSTTWQHISADFAR
jgi:hypothetical protein